MARARDDQPLVASVFDRLLDDDPDVSREPETARVQTISELRASVCRDVENLLNTRWRCESWPDEFTELGRSMVGYGIPDVNAADLRSQSERTRFFRAVEYAVTTYEPRLENVRVRSTDTGESLDRIMPFRIDASLVGQEVPEPIHLDSVVDTTTGEISVKRTSR